MKLEEKNRGKANSNNDPPILWEEVDHVDDGRHGAAIYYGPEFKREKSFPVAALREQEWLKSPTYNVVIKILHSRSSEYVNRGIDGMAVSKEIQIAVFRYLRDRKFGPTSYISEHLWIRMNG
jgi:hypothetical protein